MGQLVSQCSGRQQRLIAVNEEQPCVRVSDEPVPANTLSLADLPLELLLYHILPHVTYIDLCSLSRVNQTFKSLIDNNDNLWENAMRTEMLDKLLLDLNDEKQPLQEIIPLFRNSKDKFQYLHVQRHIRSWITASKIFGCGSRCTFCETLFFKYITIRSKIKTMRPLKRNHRLYIYFSHGELVDNLRHNMLDVQSQLLVAGPIEYFSMYPSQSRCLKCKSKCHFSVDLPQQPRPYNWFVSYLSKRSHSERIDVLEVYCPRCERYSLWKRKTYGVGAVFKPPKL
ncbi:unnamed protein product [Adineta ricciae]|uniref:F-box domain-containing protein n=1 Tax=Adineta ricciae TaxID=249248 RepID=A0A814N1M0_ADIRI|nr:unnamed protein product [Adineta ricciae]